MEQNALLVLLIEDDMDLATTVGDYLLLDNIECDYAFNGQAGLDSALASRYDLILLDLTLPRMGGLTICKLLHQKNNTSSILMLTARVSISERVAGFEAGANDYLVKPFDLQELSVRIRALIRRVKGHSNSITIGDLQINLSEQQAVRAGRKLKLSPTGWIILEQLARVSPQVMSKTDLERAVWGELIPESNSL